MKVVIYSAVVGGYDDIVQPSVINSAFDYILFSNDIAHENVGVWKIRHIDYQNSDLTRVARYVKTHPHILLSDYEYSIWIDSNIIFKEEFVYTRFEQLISNETLIAGIPHPDMDCIYDECLWIKTCFKDTLHNMLPELKYLKSQSYPLNNGLCETNILFRMHLNPQIINLCNDWWYMIETFSKRDQLSFNYVLWKNSLEFVPIFPFISDTAKSPYYAKKAHNSKRGKFYQIWRQDILPLIQKPLFGIWHFYIKHIL